MPSPNALKKPEIGAFHRDGYVVRKGLFDRDEVAAMNDVINRDPAIREATYARKDSSGASTELALWYTLGDDIFGAAARSERVVDSIEAVLGGAACFYHSKLTLKRPKVGGAWEWHQDYGYWHKNGYLCPHMASVFIAVDASTRKNGCLQVIRGSHHIGRIEHGTVGGQTGADMETVEQAMKHPHLVERQTVQTVHDRLLGDFQIPGFPLRFSSFPDRLELEAPFLGEHNGHVLSSYLGYTSEQIATLERDGVLRNLPR